MARPSGDRAAGAQGVDVGGPGDGAGSEVESDRDGAVCGGGLEGFERVQVGGSQPVRDDLDRSAARETGGMGGLVREAESRRAAARPVASTASASVTASDSTHPPEIEPMTRHSRVTAIEAPGPRGALRATRITVTTATSAPARSSGSRLLRQFQHPVTLTPSVFPAHYAVVKTGVAGRCVRRRSVPPRFGGSMRVGGLVLAAGAGTRYGRPKGLVRGADGTAWVAKAVDMLRDGGCDDVVVLVGASGG